MNKPNLVDHYRKLLAEATDEIKRLALIELLVEEQAKERVEAERSAEEAERSAERAAATATTIARVLGTTSAD